MTVRGKVPTDLSNGVGKVCNLCRVSIYSNIRILGHGRLEWPYLTWAGFVLKKIFWKKEEEMVQSTHGGTTVEYELG
jgi:hypothetical protein